MTRHGFALTGVTLPGMADLFGVWQVPAGEAVAFGAPVEPVWRVQLPGSVGEAGVLLEQKRLALRLSERALGEAERRLGRVVAKVGGSSYGIGGGPEVGPRIANSFGARESLGGRVEMGRQAAGPAGAGEVGGEPEAALLRAMRALEAPVSFALDWGEDAERREVFRHWRAFIGEVLGIVSQYARVETEVAGVLVGRTTVGWRGDFNTHLVRDATASALALHREAVALALSSRIALVRMLIVVGTGAARLALQLTVPGAQLLVLPAAWTFVRDVLKQLREWEDVR